MRSFFCVKKCEVFFAQKKNEVFCIQWWVFLFGGTKMNSIRKKLLLFFTRGKKNRSDMEISLSPTAMEPQTETQEEEEEDEEEEEEEEEDGEGK